MSPRLLKVLASSQNLSSQLIAHSSLLTTHHSLLIAQYSLLTAHCSVGYWLPASCGGMVLIRRQMLTHFPTVTQSTGFQPEPLLTTPCSLLIAQCGTGFQPAVGSVTIIRRQMLSHFPTVTQSAGFQPEPLLTGVRSMSCE